MKGERKRKMLYLVLFIISIVYCVGSLGWYGHKYYLLYELRKDIKHNTELQKENRSTELNDIITRNKIYTFNYIKEN